MNHLKHVISLLVGLGLCLLVAGTALASPEERVERIASALSDEGFSKAERLDGTPEILLFLVRTPDEAGAVTLLVRRFGSAKEARAACVGGIKRGEELRVKGGGVKPARQRVRLKGTSGVRLLRFAAPDESGSVAVVVFACGSETVELTVIGKPTPKSVKRLASKIVQTLAEISPQGAPYSKGSPQARGGAAGSLAPGQVLSTGTGFYVSETEVLSNAHVVGQANEVRLVATDGTRFMGTVKARGTGGTHSDLALIKVKRRGRPLTLAAPRNLQNVFVYGYGTLGGTTDALLATEGRISGRHQGTLITTAHVNPGNSGGPLVDTRGRAVGVVFMKTRSDASNDSLGLVIPSDVAQTWLQAHGVRLRLEQSQATGSAPNDADVREAVVRIELLSGR